ncbi:hypothetical protein [Pseudonocardia parietis]|uniref:Microcystin degradation protein MlrC n=1 Tax=Pseudonocardia parietis TaxID=570936 RepID=A0ABS4W647_9PSEU|nr:hypothetical protein [Pseudonocardia parietis]MBP2371661.1 microcystin degradation protein MlrC [Pseudonocardia parietis]
MAQQAHHLEIRTIVTTANECGEGRICPSVHEVVGAPDRLWVVSKRAADHERAAFAHVLDEGEILGWVPPGLLPDDCEAITRTRDVAGPGSRRDRVFVISSEVTDEIELIAFAQLWDPSTEQLGTVAAHTLEGVGT